MTKAEIDLLSEEELKTALVRYFDSLEDKGVHSSKELAEEFLETVFRYRRFTSVLEEELVRRVKGGQ